MLVAFKRALVSRYTTRARHFWDIVDDEYEKAVASGPPVMGRSLEDIASAMTGRNRGHSLDTPPEIFLG